MVLENNLVNLTVDHLIDLQEQLEADLERAKDDYIFQSIESELEIVNSKLQELVSKEIEESQSLTSFVNSF